MRRKPNHIRGDLPLIRYRLTDIQMSLDVLRGPQPPPTLLGPIDRLIDQVGALTDVVVVMAIETGFPAPRLVPSASDALEEDYGAGCDDPSRVVAAEITAVHATSEHDIDGKGHVIGCLYPFDFPHSEAVNRLIQVGPRIWQIRAVERMGRDVGRGQAVGFVVSPIPLRSAAPGRVVGDLGHGSREQTLVADQPLETATLLLEGPFKSGALQPDSPEDGQLAAVFSGDGQPFCMIERDTVVGGDQTACEARAAQVAMALNHYSAVLRSWQSTQTWPPMRLTDRQRAWLGEASRFVWDEEGEDNDKLPRLTLEEWADMAHQLAFGDIAPNPNLVLLSPDERAYLRWAIYSTVEAQEMGPKNMLEDEALTDLVKRLGRPDQGDEFANGQHPLGRTS